MKLIKVEHGKKIEIELGENIFIRFSLSNGEEMALDMSEAYDEESDEWFVSIGLLESDGEGEGEDNFRPKYTNMICLGRKADMSVKSSEVEDEDDAADFLPPGTWSEGQEE